MIQCFMICELRAQDISCAFCLCLLESYKMNWIWVFIVWDKKTSRYAHFGHNLLIVYGHPVSRLVLPLQPQFWISEHPVCRLWNSVSRLSSRNILPKFGLPFVRIRIAACYSNCYSELCFKITVWPKNFIKLCYDPKRYKFFQIGPLSEFLNITLLILKLYEIKIWPKICEIIVWPKTFKYFQIGPNPKFKTIIY